MNEHLDRNIVPDQAARMLFLLPGIALTASRVRSARFHETFTAVAAVWLVAYVALFFTRLR